VHNHGAVLILVQEAGQIISWVDALKNSLIRQDQERRDIENLLACFPTPVWSAVQELKKERDDKANRVLELEEKWSNLDSECREMHQEHNQFRKEVELLKLDLDVIRRERLQLQDLNQNQQLEKIQLHKLLKNMEKTLILEGGIQKSLAIAIEGAKVIMEADKVELIRKDFEDLYSGEPQAFKTLYKAMQMFSDDIMKFKEGLERELKVTREYCRQSTSVLSISTRNGGRRVRRYLILPLMTQKEVDWQSSGRRRWMDGGSR
jgi:hypothetical protein